MYGVWCDLVNMYSQRQKSPRLPYHLISSKIMRCMSVTVDTGVRHRHLIWRGVMWNYVTKSLHVLLDSTSIHCRLVHHSSYSFTSSLRLYSLLRFHFCWLYGVVVLIWMVWSCWHVWFGCDNTSMYGIVWCGCVNVLCRHVNKYGVVVDMHGVIV